MRVSQWVSGRRAMGAAVLLWWAASVSPAVAAGDGTMRGVLVRIPRPYDEIVNKIRDLGGEVTQQYENVDAIAAIIPEAEIPKVLALVGPNKVSKDPMVAQPHSIDRARGRLTGSPDGTSVEAAAAWSLEESQLRDLVAQPTDYSFTNDTIGATALHTQGYFGQGVVVAVIDSGTTKSPTVPAVQNNVIGGENFVAADPVTSATSRLNGAHGTWVGSVIASNVIFGFANTSQLVSSIRKFAPSAFYGPCPVPPTTGNCLVPQVGVAPLASLYALKVFDSRGGGSPESRVIAAMDRAITLRKNFNHGAPAAPVAGDGTEDNPYVYDSLNIQVVNMSLGGGTLFAGRDLEDQLTVKMLKEGIVLATSAGNDGFAAMTGGSPGSGLGSLTVGASSDAVNERIVADTFLVPGFGELYRPTTHTQTADFSSRGPTADGRFDPDIVANGAWSFAQGTCQGRAACVAGTGLAPNNFVSGTSFSSPTAAGAAALLRQAFPLAAPGSVRNAMIAGANPTTLGDRSTRIDQGRGFLDVAAAAARLNAGISPRIERAHPTPLVEENIERLGYRPVRLRHDSFETSVKNLLPGQVAQFFVESDFFTDQLTVDVTGVTPELPPGAQNAIFGDDVIFKIVDAPTSFQDRNVTEFVSADSTFTLDHPQTGLLRVAVMGDWTNAGKVSANLRIRRGRHGVGFPSASGFVREGDMIPFEVQVPSGAAEAVFATHFLRDWGHYPTSDIDMVLVDPNGAVNVEGATLSSPERAVIANPVPGAWTVLVSAFALPANTDAFALFAKADGVRLAATR